MEQESIEKAVAFIETHLTEEWSLETLAREAGYSRTTSPASSGKPPAVR